jgi:hypothetical protein
VINGELAVLPHAEVSYEEVTSIAYPVAPAPGTIYTTTYTNAEAPKRDGILVPGHVVTVKITGTEFDVTPTGKS